MSQSIKEAFETLKTAIQSDPSYAWSWHCNVAMASVDEGMPSEAANKAADRFMQICFGVRTLGSFGKVNKD